MAGVKIFLCGNLSDRIFLSGNSDGGPLRLNALVLPGNETLTLAEMLEIRRELVAEQPAGSGEFVFKPFGEVGVTLEAELLLAAGGKFFGRRLRAEAGGAARLTVRIPPAGGVMPSGPFVELEVCGIIEVNAGRADFTTETLCFLLTADDLPSSPASINPPSLRLALPNIGFDLPHLPLAWDFPSLPPLPWKLPTLSISRGSFPLSVSWKSARIDPQPDRVVLDVEHLRIGTEHGAVEGDLRLVVSGGRVNVADSFFHLYRPDFANRVQIPISEWHFDEQCVGLKWMEPELKAWLRLLSPEFAERTQAVAGTSVALRLMREGNGLDEIRLDWETEAAAVTTIDLPGFNVTIPPIRMYTLVIRREEKVPDEDDVTEEREWLTLLATLREDTQQEEGDIPDGADDPDEQGDDNLEGPTFDAPNVSGLAIVAASDFTFARGGGERELHRDDARPAEPLIKFTAAPKKNLSVVLFDLPLSGGGGVGFFKQLDHALRPLVFSEGAARAWEPTDCHPVSLRRNDWDLKIDFNATEARQFFLPFLKKDSEPGALENLSQKLGIKAGTQLEVDFGKHQIECHLDIDVALGGMRVSTDAVLTFDWERFAFSVNDLEGFKFKRKEELRGEFLGLTWVFKPTPSEVLFRLVTKDSNFHLKQEPGSTLMAEFSRATSPQQPIVFILSDFVITPGGVSVDGRVADSPARLTGINEQFRFTEGSFQIRDNHLTDFSISGSGPLPPALVGNAVASISLQFGQRDGRLELVSGAAQLRGTKLLKCQGTRFQFSVDGIGLKFVNDGRYHLYFTVTGTARFVPFAADDASGPLAWLPAVELQLIECPLTGDASVLKKHVKFLIDLPKKKTFEFLGCFKMELRGVGFVPQADEFGGDPAMELSGQVKFADGDGDVIDARVDFHSLFVGLPAPGSVVPRIHCADLGVKIRTGVAFELEGTVDYLDDEEIEPGLRARGFSGEGSLSIQGLPTMAASFSFIRVSRDGGRTWVRAWFIYLEARKLSLLIPVIQIYIREVGLGFGYRYTLASIKAADQTEDPRELLKVLTKLSRTQGQLSRRDQWRVDLEEPGEDARWTVALRALISQTSAAAGPLDWNAVAERNLSCLFVMDVVIALRNDLTFLMTGRAWLNTNYNDFLCDVRSLQTKPLLSGFVLLSPRRKRLLAHLASNPGAEFGDHPPLPGFLKQALAESNFSATLLIEPGLLHYELGWPNMLRWRSKLGPLTAEFRGGTIFRVSRRELVIGNSFLARGSLVLSAEVNLGVVGARLSAVADVAYGARYIGVIAFDDPLARSALYGAVGVEINVTVRIDFWLRIKVGFVKITLRFGFSFAINLTAFLEIGLTAGDLVGARGTATVSLRIMGRGLRFGIHVGINESAVDAARRITSEYLNIGLEATEVEPVPGSRNGALPPANELPTGPDAPAADTNRPSLDSALIVQPTADVSAAVPGPTEPSSITGNRGITEQMRTAIAATPTAEKESALFETPNYTLFSVPFKEASGQESRYFVLLPGAPSSSGPSADAEHGFLPVPPNTIPTPEDDFNDFEWKMPASDAITVRRFNPTAKAGETPWPVVSDVVKWRAKWDQSLGRREIVNPENGEPVNDDGSAQDVSVKSLITHAFITKPKDNSQENDLDAFEPIEDPEDDSTDGEVVLEDERVHHPSDDAFEAAVRGAAEQFEGSPNLKHPDSEWGEALKEAFSPDTSVYSETGDLTPAVRAKAERTQQAVEMRSLIIKQLIEGLQEFAALVNGNDDNLASAKVQEVIEKSLAFQMGLVFKTEGGRPDWLVSPDPAGEIIQRRRIDDPQPTPPEQGKRFVKPFNTSETSFVENPPQFQRIKHYADSNTIAITWDLLWPSDKTWTAATAPAQREPEQHLRHYLVRRRPLAGDEPEAEFTVKHVEVLRRKDNVVQRIRPRFQSVDHFNHETTEDQAALPAEGKSYLYTIIPVDVAGGLSPRPLTIIATRRPNAPPAVPADGELVVKYRFDKIEEPSEQATALEPERILVTWTQAPPPSDGPQIPVKETRLIFRKEATLPAGSYALDADAQGGRASGLPTSNARVLRTDVVVTLSKPSLRQNRFESALELKALRDEHGIFPREGWRPEAWRVFIQTVSDGDVQSALAPVEMVLQFRTTGAANDPARSEERRPAQLEWLTKPILFKALPPEDERAEDGFAKVPMPIAADGPNGPIGQFKPDSELVKLVEYEAHPLGLRCLRFEWNQGPNRVGSYPLELHAGYRLYEFDLDAHTAGLLDAPPADLWGRMRRTQEMEILLAEGLLLTPANTLTTPQWEAWYPSLVRRRRLREQKKETVPPKQSEARLSPWYTWRDSYLEWPEDASLRQPEGNEPTAGEVTGLMRIFAATEGTKNRIVASKEGLDAIKPGQNFRALKPGQYVRISGAKSPANNGVKRIKTASESVKEFELTFEPGSFDMDEPLAAEVVVDGVALKDDRVVKGPMKIHKPQGFTQWRITSNEGKLTMFSPGQHVRITNALLPGGEAIRKVVAPERLSNNPQASQKENELSFEESAFTSELEGELTIDAVALTVDGSPFRSLHPLLEKLAEEFGGKKIKVGDKRVEVTLDFAPPPPEQPGDLNAVLKATAPDIDPYGWSILKRMGLSITFTLRERRTGNLPQLADPLTVKPEGVARDIHLAMRDILQPYMSQEDYARHLHVEYLFQPAKSMRLEDESGVPSEGDLLALIQLSLRPAARQALGYQRVEIGTGVGGKRIRITVNPGAAPSTLIEQTGIAAPIELPAGEEFKKDVRLPASGVAVILIRSTKPEAVVISARALDDQTQQETGTDLPPLRLSLHPTEWPVLVFSPAPAPWPLELPQTEIEGAVKSAWARFRSYLLRMNPAEAASATEPKIEFPKDENGIVTLMSWLNRFFEAGGDDRTADDAPGGEGTLAGPWVAAAYPRAASPVGVAPDAAGRLKFYQPVEDQWAHVYRYFIVPQGRYDRLWQALAQSSALFPPEDRAVDNLKVKLENLERLRGLPPPEGGIDIVLDRIKSVAAPLVLFSGRLDRKTGPADVPPPGKVWEVIIAKHPEQLLVERNRTLARHLSYRHVAYTLLRRFTFTGHLEEFRKLLANQGHVLNVQLAENVFPETPGFDDYSDPEHLDLEQPDADEARTLEIAERIGGFGKGALVLQWDALPYFYEHRLLLVAQTTARVSPVTDLVQRDFEYRSPTPFATAGGRLFESDKGRSLLLLIELRSFWSCLPPEAQERWPSERWRDAEADNQPSPVDEAETGGTHRRQLSSLPDTGVVYQIAMRRPSGLNEVLSELFFEPEPSAGMLGSGSAWKGYKVRLFNQKFTTSVGKIRVPRPDEIKPLHLETRVSMKSEVALIRGAKTLEVNGDFTPPALNRVLLNSIEELKVVPGKKPAQDAGPEEVSRFLKRWYAVRAVSYDDVTLEGTLRDKVDFFDPESPKQIVAWTGEGTADLLAALESWASANPPPVADVLRDITQKVSAGGTQTVIASVPQAPTALPDTLRLNVLVGKKLLRSRSPLDPGEQEQLLAAYSASAPDQASLKRLFDDLADRQTLENFLVQWASEQAVSGRSALPDFATGHERIEFPAPTSCMLVLTAVLITSETDGKKHWEFLTEAERRELRALAANSDISFGLAVRSLLEQEALAVLPEPVKGEPAPALFAEAGVGFEQVAEIAEAGRYTLPTASTRAFVWKGMMREEEHAVFARWVEVSSFGRTFSALLKAADACELTFNFDETEPFPPQPPPVLASRLVISAPEVKWKGLKLRIEEEEALEALGQDASFGETFRKAIKDILEALREPDANPRARAEAGVEEPDWSPRPKPGTLLPRKLLVGNGHIRFYGWMSREEARSLLKQQGLTDPDREAVKRLFGDSLRAGFGGGTLEIRARRGSSPARAGKLGGIAEEK